MPRAANPYDFDRIHTIFRSKYGDTVYNKNSTISRKSGRISVILRNIDIRGKDYTNPEKMTKKQTFFNRPSPLPYLTDTISKRGTCHVENINY